MAYKLINKEGGDRLVETNDIWPQAVSSEAVGSARKGEQSIVLTPKKPIPMKWLPERKKGFEIIYLASGGDNKDQYLLLKLQV